MKMNKYLISLTVAKFIKVVSAYSINAQENADSFHETIER